MTAATGPPDHEVEAAQVAALFGQMPLAVVVATVNAVFLALVVSQGSWSGLPLIWLAAMLAASCRCYGGCPSGAELVGCGCEANTQQLGAPDGQP
jgi:hypothetical protein